MTAAILLLWALTGVVGGIFFWMRKRDLTADNLLMHLTCGGLLGPLWLVLMIPLLGNPTIAKRRGGGE